MNTDTYKEIMSLSRMTVGELREKYLEVFGEETRSHHKDFLRKRIAWRLQALAEGDLSERARRRAEERDHLAWLFTRLLVLSESRGPHATGVAWLNRDGEHCLFKRPVPAGQFVTDKAFQEVLAGMDNRATLLVGHTRWRTRGDERINRNNHPIRAGDVIGTHNGTIYNADHLFRRLRLRRFADVDSELLFRLADRAFRDETPDLERFKRDLALCRGQITAVLASRRRPGTVLVLKGNKPLELRIHRRHRAVLYASDPAFLDAVLADERGWRPLPLEPMTMLVFRHESLMEFSRESFTFIAQGKRGKAP